MAELKVPTEMVDLPSKGLLYPEENPLSLGRIEMKYMTAREEDILTNTNYIKDGTVMDRLLKSLIVSKVNYDDLLIGDKNAIYIAARILGYGKDYTFLANDGNKYTCDLTQLENKKIEEDLFAERKNEFEYTLPFTQNKITFKLLTHGDEKKIDEEIKGLQKVNPKGSYDRTTRLKHIITSVNGARETAAIREFVDKHLLARDSKALREYIKRITPDVDLTVHPDGVEEGIELQIGLDFFWPTLE